MRHLIWLLLFFCLPSFAFLSSPGVNNTLGLICTSGQVPSWSGAGFTTCLSASGSGTVTSYAVHSDSTTDSIFANASHILTGGAITASGFNTLTLSSQSANTFLRAPNGSSGTPVFGLIVNADLPAVISVGTSLTSPIVSSSDFTSGSANPASAGILRLANSDSIKWRNAGNTADIALGMNGSNVFTLGSSLNIGTTSGADNGVLLLQSSGTQGSGASPFIRAFDTAATEMFRIGMFNGTHDMYFTNYDTTGKVILQSNSTTGFSMDQNQAITLGHYGTGLAHFGSAGLLTSSLASLTADVSGILPIANGGSGTSSASAAFNNFSPMTTLGDVIYGGASGAGTRLAGDVSNTRKFLRTQSSGGVATAPVWDTIQAGDVPTLNQNTSGTAADLSATLSIAHGGTNSSTSLSNNRFMVSSGSKIVEASAVTANSLVVSDSNGLPTASTVTTTVLADMLIRGWNGMIETPSNKTYTIMGYAPYPGTINSAWMELVSGTLTAAVKINGTNVTGLSAVSVSSTGANTSASAANTFAVGDKITVVVSSVATPVDFDFDIKYTVN